MLEKFKANILFSKLLQRPNIEKAYAMVKETEIYQGKIKEFVEKHIG